jgi:hypothetical protein
MQVSSDVSTVVEVFLEWAEMGQGLAGDLNYQRKGENILSEQNLNSRDFTIVGTEVVDMRGG